MNWPNQVVAMELASMVSGSEASSTCSVGSEGWFGVFETVDIVEWRDKDRVRGEWADVLRMLLEQIVFVITPHAQVRAGEGHTVPGGDQFDQFDCC